MATLREQVTEIMNERATQRVKRAKLLAIGITDSDIKQLFFAERLAARQARRAALQAQQVATPQQEQQHAQEQERIANERLANIERIIAKYTFGVEIECYNVNVSALENIANSHGLEMHRETYNHNTKNHYKLVSDASIRGNDGIECVTPVLQAKRGFDSLKACCESLEEAGAKVNRSTGLHIHVGGNFTDQQYVNTFVNYLFLEKVIDTFMANSRRSNNNVFCKTLQSCATRLQQATTIDGILSALFYDRYFKVNPCSYNRHKTIEFRQHQGTIEYEKISNWARFCIKLVEWSATHRLSNYVASIDDIEFLTEQEKAYFKQRADKFSQQTANVA